MALIDLDDTGWGLQLGGYIRTICRESVADNAPEFSQDLPGAAPWHLRARIADGWLFAHWSESAPNRVNSFDNLDETIFLKLREASVQARSYAELKERDTLAEYFSHCALLLVLKVEHGKLDTDAVDEGVMAWLNDLPLAYATEVNRRRVDHVVVRPPVYDVAAIARACWVVESESDIVQGTAFSLSGVGLVTCAHVVLDVAGREIQDLILYRAGAPNAKIAVRQVMAHPAIDLAVLHCEIDMSDSLFRADSAEIDVLSPVAVCGFPNHRPGDSVVLSPGHVTGHRTVSGVRRILTNAGIVTGMSGGPAIDPQNRVIGVCANGADYMYKARETEDQAIILIQALDRFDWRHPK